MIRSYKHLYSRFLSTNPERLHFAAHSHHLWPDVTRDAQLQVWDDAAREIDDKWDTIFGSVIPEAQSHIARLLELPRPDLIAFAPNTHEFVVRLLSCFPEERPLRVLTTDGEFHSFSRQLQRYQELRRVTAERVPVEPFATFEDRFKSTLQASQWDLVFCSTVFFQYGYALSNLQSIVDAAPPETSIVFDGYHSFCALPISLKGVAERAFFLAGGYKYAQAGEGACFLCVPPSCQLRPLNTGWFASFSTLTDQQSNIGQMPFADDAFRFWGATFDPSGLYRFNAVQNLFLREELEPRKIHGHVHSLQSQLLRALEEQNPDCFKSCEVLLHDPDWHGHFLSLRTPQADKLCSELRSHNIMVDTRGDLLRIGIGLYHDSNDVDELLRRLRCCSRI